MESWTGRYVQQQSSFLKDFGFVVEDFGSNVKVYWRNIGNGEPDEKAMEKASLTISDNPPWDIKTWVETHKFDKKAAEAKAKESRTTEALIVKLPHDETRIQEIRIHEWYESPRLRDRFDELNAQCFSSELPRMKTLLVKQIEGDLVDGTSIVVKNLVADAGGLFVPQEHSPLREAFICMREDTPDEYEGYVLLHEMTHARVYPGEKKHGKPYIDELTRALGLNGWEVLGCKDKY
jgi:hypothetical protein